MDRICVIGVLLFLALDSGAQTTVHVAVVLDGPQYEFQQIAPIFRNELVSLTEGEFSIEFKEFSGNWSQQSIRRAFSDAYRDPEVDLVLALGFAGNQVSVSNASFPKPTFLPLVFDAQLTGAPGDGSTSRKKNLNYLAERVSLTDELRTYQRVTPFNTATVIIDQLIFDAVPRIETFASAAAKEIGITLSFVGHDGNDHDLARRIAPDTEAILFTGLPRLPPEALEELIETLTQRRIALFSLSDRSLVERGMLAADTVDTDWQRLGRRNALNMQAVLLGEKTENLPVFFQGKQELTINLKTARRIGLSPRFDVLSEATLLNDVPEQNGPEFDLNKVARTALAANLDLRAETLGAVASSEDIRVARSALFPQLALGTRQTRRRISPNVEAGLLAEQSTDASLSLSQTLFSDDTYAGLDIQRYSQSAIDAGLDGSRLDTVRDASLAYLDVLQAENQLVIQKDNLELTKSNLDLARDRVRIGTSTDTDVFRWQSNLATARGDLLRSRAQVAAAREALNRLLNRAVDSTLRLKPATKRDAFSISTQRFDEIVNNPRAFGWVADYAIQNGHKNAPELAQIDAQIAAKDREIRNRSRDYWLPDFSLDTEYSDNLAQSGVGAGGLGDGEHDWSVAINARLPLFSGGARRAELSRSRLELQRLKIEREAAAEKIEQQIRAAMHQLYASYANIKLSNEAATAARKTLELVTDAYAQGTLSILDLLDAQSQSLSADLSANNSVYVFLGDAIRLQRASSNFEYLLPADEAAINSKRLEEYLNSRQAELASTQR